MIQPPPPAELAFLTDVIGAEATLALIEARGGTRIYVTSGESGIGRPAEVLSGIIGNAATTALAAQFGGCYLSVPSAKRWRALVYRERGLSEEVVASMLRLNRRTVQRYLAGSLGTRQHAKQTPQRHPGMPFIRQTELPV